MASEAAGEQLKYDQLVALGPCAKCGKKLLESPGGVACMFYVVEIKSALTLPGAIQRLAGLQMQIGAALACVMGPDEAMAAALPPTRLMLHQSCALEMTDLMCCLESASKRQE